MKILTLLLVAAVSGGAAAGIDTIRDTPAAAHAAAAPVVTGKDLATLQHAKQQIAALDARLPGSIVVPVDLPGELKGGAVACWDAAMSVCQPADENGLTVRVVDFDPETGFTRVMLNGNILTAPYGGQVLVTYKGCDMSLASFLAHSYCPGVN